MSRPPSGRISALNLYVKLKSNPYIVTGLSSLIVGLAGLLTYKMVATWGDIELLYDYSAGRRLLSFLVPVFALGFGVGLPLRISRRPSVPESQYILRLQFLIAVAVAALFIAVTAIADEETLARYLSGLSRSELYSIICAGLSLNFTAITYAYYRGFEQFTLGARLIVLSNGLFPVGALMALEGGLEGVFYVWAVPNVIVTLVSVRWLWGNSVAKAPKLKGLIFTSLCRVPGDAAYAGLFLLPVLLAHGRADIIESSVFNYFFVIAGVVVAVAAPVSVVMLPMVGRVVVADGRGAARAMLMRMAVLALALGALMAGVLSAVPQFLTTVLLSGDYLSGAGVLATLAPAVVGLTVYVLVKSIVDGANERPYTAYTSVASMLVFLLIVRGSSSNMTGLIWATNVSLLFLGFSTLFLGWWLTRSEKTPC